MIAAAQHTIVDLADPIVSGTAPTAPMVDMLWMDTSVSPALLKRWNGSAWELVNDAQIGSRNLIAEGCFKNGLYTTESPTDISLIELEMVEPSWVAYSRTSTIPSGTKTHGYARSYFTGRSCSVFTDDMMLIHRSAKYGTRILPQRQYTLSYKVRIEAYTDASGTAVDVATLTEDVVRDMLLLLPAGELWYIGDDGNETGKQEHTPMVAEFRDAAVAGKPEVVICSSFVSSNSEASLFAVQFSSAVYFTEDSVLFSITEIQLEEGGVKTGWKEADEIASLPKGTGRNLIVDGRFVQSIDVSQDEESLYGVGAESGIATPWTCTTGVQTASVMEMLLGDGSVPLDHKWLMLHDAIVTQGTARHLISIDPSSTYTLSMKVAVPSDNSVGLVQSFFCTLNYYTAFTTDLDVVASVMVPSFGVTGVDKQFIVNWSIYSISTTFATPPLPVENGPYYVLLGLFPDAVEPGATAGALITDVKLEKGSTATEWSEAPEAYTSPFYSPLEPLIFPLGGLWMDTSQNPPVLKTWTKEGWQIVDEALIGGRNLLRHSGHFASLPSDWSPISTGTLATASVDDAQCLYMLSDGAGAEIKQNRVYHLDFDTTYVYHAMYMRNHTVEVNEFNPISCYAQVVTSLDDEPTTREAIASYELMSDKTTDRGAWEHTILKFKTVARPTDTTTDEDGNALPYYIAFTPRIEGIAVADISDTEAGRAALWLKWIMLEEGNTPSDWSPAPEDAQEEINKTQQDVDALVSRVEKAELKIEDAAIIATVLSSEEYKTRIESMEANMELNKNEFDVRFTEINQQIIDNEANDSAFRNEVTSWMNFSKDAVLEIGKNDSDFKMNLSNTQLSFLYKGTEMAYFGTDNGMYINKAVIKDSLTVGNITMVGDSKGRMLWV